MAKAYEENSLTSLADKVVKAFERKGYVLERGLGQYNIFYIEGMAMDGSPNVNTPNQYNDIRGVLTFQGNIPVITTWPATTEPGEHYTTHPLNEGGAARIAFGQYRAWQVGLHHGSYEALVQTGGEVTVCRDRNEDYKREGDRLDRGYFGINQHHGSNSPISDIGYNSAGCLVTPKVSDHQNFMKIVKTDPRYLADHQYKFYTAIFPSSDIY